MGTPEEKKSGVGRPKEERSLIAGERLKKARELKGKRSPKALADDDKWRKCQIAGSADTIREWESIGIPFGAITSVAQYFCVSRNYFLDKAITNEAFEKAILPVKSDDNKEEDTFCRDLGYPLHKEIVPYHRFNTEKTRLENEVFVSQLLRNPINFSKENDRITVRINRNGVQCAIISPEARKIISELFVKGNERILKKKEEEIQNFLIEKTDKIEPIDPTTDKLPLPLRWASGGVLSIVKFEGKKWVPFFWRDVKPYGWNIPLGSSERHFDENGSEIGNIDEELNRPWRFLLREFIEEILIVDGKPAASRHLGYKECCFRDMDVERTVKLTGKFSEKHIYLRGNYDDIYINKSNDPRLKINVDLLNTATDIDIYHKNNTEHTSNILISFNLLELGVEVVKVIEYSLADTDYILDGEILLKNGIEELVRMPVGLISCKYLEGEFGKNYNPDKLTEGIMPSLQVNPIPPEEFHLFEWDIIQRVKIIKGEKQGIGIEKERYTNWYYNPDLKTKEYFLDENDNPRHDNPCPLFTPATAKILNSFFTKKIAGKIQL